HFTASLSPRISYALLAPTLTSTLPLHDALPISSTASGTARAAGVMRTEPPWWCSTRGSTSSVSTTPPPAQSTGTSPAPAPEPPTDRKSTRLNSSHVSISYAVFCLTEKKHILISL